ncbi:hypothetical protein [Streptomyces europaeiscabiei]|uniref:hypothetical protein n=1 Tax=Streptomyces europaeiscabiei TaxID=146819 RepID=UPI002E13F030|nr:hypothetical protein OHB30_36970 [Streptomyces europaeiscabiei]
MRTQIITAVVGVVGTGLGASLALIGTAWQARRAARSKRQELVQSKEQARTQLYVDHVGRRLENRRATYIAFMQAVSTLVQATRDDRIDGARLTGQLGGRDRSSFAALHAARQPDGELAVQHGFRRGQVTEQRLDSDDE